MVEDELLDLVDKNDKVIGKKLRSQVYKEKLSNFRAVCGFIVNSQGKIWIPRRTANKRIFPLCLDMSIAGHVESGEDYDETFKRETKEEINLNIKSKQWKVLGKMTPGKDKVAAFIKVYEIRLEKVNNYNSKDFIEAFWLYPKEIIEKIEKGDKAKDDLIPLVKKFYL